MRLNLLSWFFSSGYFIETFLTKRATCTVHVILMYFIVLVILERSTQITGLQGTNESSSDRATVYCSSVNFAAITELLRDLVYDAPNV
jgi:hypothetical protein